MGKIKNYRLLKHMVRIVTNVFFKERIMETLVLWPNVKFRINIICLGLLGMIWRLSTWADCLILCVLGSHSYFISSIKRHRNSFESSSHKIKFLRFGTLKAAVVLGKTPTLFTLLIHLLGKYLYRVNRCKYKWDYCTQSKLLYIHYKIRNADRTVISLYWF